MYKSAFKYEKTSMFYDETLNDDHNSVASEIAVTSKGT